MYFFWLVQRFIWVRVVYLLKIFKEFVVVLFFLESLIRLICYFFVWNDVVGYVELYRMVFEVKQVGIKKKDYKEEEEEFELEYKGFGECMLFCFFVLLV